ncbi:hypothetical protein [Desulfobulbus sp.]|uniref:hypothetical protein n=1 Tax=Desulfobulbus sp. TaxID=895 RepID=UPI00286F5B16|nr:hypothetical protein [Desulfobulbus sp.]
MPILLSVFMAPLYWFAKAAVKKMHSRPLISPPINGYNGGMVTPYAHKIIHFSCVSHAPHRALPLGTTEIINEKRRFVHGVGYGDMADRQRHGAAGVFLCGGCLWN